MKIKRTTTKPKKLRKLLAVLLAAGFMTVAGMNVANADTTLTPTLQTINGRTTYIVNNDTTTPYGLTLVGSDPLPANAVTLKIGSNTYYYTPTNMPEGYTLTDYQNLSNTGGVALKTQTGSAFADAINLVIEGATEAEHKYYSYTVANLPTSAYTITGPNDPAVSGDINIGGKIIL